MGDRDAPWDRFRAYLIFQARARVDPRLAGKLDLSGVVQQTLLEAHRTIADLGGWNEDRQAAWLRQALAHNLADEIRKLRAAGRDATRERSLEEAAGASSARLEAWLAAEQSSPSEQAQRRERALRVAEALEGLPADQREALVLQHWHGWTLARIAEHLGRTPGSVAGLVRRGLDRLRESLPQE
jgi:RNA polymerase sigma-70 factor (ECF subfamily)